MEFWFWITSSIIFCLNLFKNPISMAGMVVMISLLVVSMIASMFSFWFSYVLFLVYVGGLLVMFIYICLVSSNHSFIFSVNGLIFAASLGFLASLNSSSALSMGFLGGSTWVSGQALLEVNNVSLLLFLVVLLLVMLLVVVRITSLGSFSVVNEKN
uniref:NADH dehydrogenase subunit 6 n=1 Tax=Notodoris gardineri TaxID=407123 RepID=E6Y194_NOTGA|nr:NADH dehydrogenase subunit 6 [Notodoris gardineri]ABL09047.1 NADH dehydrogenase subunit 6 [Notodoris gardineri]